MKWFERYAAEREPDFIIGGRDDPYVKRWWVIPRNRWFNIYLHQFLRSDDDRALHDHPWVNLSVLLQGEYREHTIAAGGVGRVVTRRAGEMKLRLPGTAHRIEIDRPCWTLFITGPVVRNWGFHCPKGWRPWQQFVDKRDSGSIGRGCD
jgi:hypothetical protein